MGMNQTSINWCGERVLVLAPHQDDEAIGCGGLLEIARRSGATTGVLWVSRTVDGAAVSDEARTAADILGLNWFESLGAAPVGFIVDHEALVSACETIRRFRPTVMLIPHADEDDRHHQQTNKLGMEIAWLSAYEWEAAGIPLPHPPTVFSYEVWTPARRPTHHLNIAEVAETKRKAISAYGSQIRIQDFAHAALGLNSYRGIMSGTSLYAEAFTLEKMGINS